LFSNEDEIKSLYQVDSINEALHQLRSDCEFAAVTRNEHGSVVIDGEEVVIIDAEPVDSVVDATGAGDMYAAGFLYGFVRGKTIEQCGKIGSIVASEVITHMGPRPLVSLTSVVPKDLLSF
jgi:sugar/nucleoside kinase (ribokinase family)